jgi:peptidoglycan/LPS O-acetylase OafA/YrhL
MENNRHQNEAADQTDLAQTSLGPGWWKTGAGWKSVLKSDRIDPRAKIAVIALIVLMFVVFGIITNWKGWAGYGFVAAALIVVVLVFSPKNSENRS